MFLFSICRYRISDVWYSDSDGEDIKRNWIQERVRSMDMGRGLAIPKPSGRSAEVGRDLPRAYVRECKPFVRDNPVELVGVGRGARVSSDEMVRRVTASDSRLVREEADRESPVTGSDISVVSARDSRPVREEAVGSFVGDSRVSVVASNEPSEVKKHGGTPCGHLWNGPHLQA